MPLKDEQPQADYVPPSSQEVLASCLVCLLFIVLAMMALAFTGNGLGWW